MNHGTVAQSQHQRLKGAEAFDPPAKIYSFKGGRIMEACAGAMFFAFIALMFLFGSVASGVICVLLVGVLALGFLERSLRSPYELRIAPSGLLRFTSVTGSTDLCAADIVRLVRTERVSNGKLYDIRVKYGAGSITLDGREDVFARLARLVPTAHVSKEKFDDTGD